MTCLFGLVLGRSGAPDFSLALGYCARYVIIDSSSILGLTISSGLMSYKKRKLNFNRLHIKANMYFKIINKNHSQFLPFFLKIKGKHNNTLEL